MKNRLTIIGSACAEIIAKVNVVPSLLIFAMLAFGSSTARAYPVRGPVIQQTNMIIMAQGATTNIQFIITDEAVGWSGIQDTIATFVTNGIFSNTMLTVTNFASPYGPPPGWTNAYSYETNRLTITPGNNYGTNVIHLISTDVWGDSTTNTFNLQVYHVSQAPAFALRTNQYVVLEESGLQTNVNFVTGVTNGAGNPTNLTWSFNAITSATTATNGGVTFLVPPKFVYNGTNGTTANLVFAPTNHSYGSNLVSVVMTDTGANINNGRVASTNTFWLVVQHIAHAPVISWGTNLVKTTLENGSVLSNLVINVTDDSPGASLGLTAVSQNSSVGLASVLSTNVISGTNTQFTVSFAPVANAFGAATNLLTAHYTAGNQNYSSASNLVLNVTHVSQPPTLSLATNAVVVLEETSSLAKTNFVTGIGAGAGNPAAAISQFSFTVTTVTNSAANAQFTVLPAVGTNGLLTFTPKPHSFGTNLVTLMLTDAAETTNNGGIKSFTTNFLVKVVQISHTPVITTVANQTVLENKGGTNVTISLSDYDALSNNLALTVSTVGYSNATSVATASITATNVINATNTQFTLHLVPVTNSFGTNIITLKASELAGTTNTSTNTFNLVVTHVTQPPSFMLSTNLITVPERAVALAVTNANFLTAITNGAGNLPPGTNWTFTLTALNKALFTNQPAIAHNGTLTFTPLAKTNGTTTVTVVMTDAATTESTANGGTVAFTNSFTLAISYVSLTPSYALVANALTVPEHSGLITSNFLTSITPGLGNPAGTLWSFTVSCPTNAPSNVMFAQFPSVTTNGTLTFATADYSYGTNTVTVVMTDINSNNISGQAFTNSFTLNVPWINQAPSFNLGASSVTVDKYDVPVVVSNACLNILAGPPNETNIQTVVFNLSDTNSGLFTTPPAIDNQGTLTFTPGDQGGTVTLQVQAQDNGGTANGGVNVSTNQALTIVIPANKFQNEAGTFSGVFYGTNTVAMASSGYFSLALATNGTFGGYVLCGNDSNTFSGQFSLSNYSASVTASDYALNLTFNADAQAVSGSVSNLTATWNSTLQSYFSGYDTSMDGTYLAAQPGFNVPHIGTAGDNAFLIGITNGLVSLTGNLADLTQVSVAGPLCTNGYYPVYMPLYTNVSGANGLIIGWLNFNNVANSSVSPGSTLTWLVTPDATALYPNGFTNTSIPLISTFDPTLPQLLPINKGYVEMSGGDLFIPVVEAVTVVNNQIIPDPTVNNGLNLAINPVTGEVQGSFVDGDGDTNQIESVALQNDGLARGYFQGVGQSGSFVLVANAVVPNDPPYPAFAGAAPHGAMVASGVTVAGVTNLTILENANTNNLRLALTLYDPLTNGFTVKCSSSNTNVATVSLTGTGTHRDLWFAPVTNQFGDNITVLVTADDATLTNTFTINLNVAFVNHAPSFTLTTNAYTADKYGVAVSVPFAITNISAGPASESAETVAFTVVNNSSNLFLVQPAVDANGTLTFTPNNVGGGAVAVQVTAQDNGGTDNGGVDTSAPQTITINIPANPFQSLTSGPSSIGAFTGLFADNTALSPVMDSSGLFVLSLTNDGTFSGYILNAGVTNEFSGQFGIAGLNASVTCGAGNYALSLTLDPAHGTVSGSVASTSPAWTSTLQSYLAAAPSLAGDYRVALPGLASGGPAGDSVFTVSVDTNGVASLSGYLADSNYVTLASQLSAEGNCPVYIPLYTNNVDAGLLFGWLNFTNDANNAVMASSSLTWFNKAGATVLNAAGFTNNAVPVASLYNNSAPNEFPDLSHYAVLTGGIFGTAHITNAVTIVNDAVTVDPSATNGLSLTINETTGEIQGSFVDGSGATNYIESVILQNTNIARGFFASATGGGSFVLLDNYPAPASPYPIIFTGITNVTVLENATTLAMPFVIFDPLTTTISSVGCSANTNVTVAVNGSELDITPVANFAGNNISFTVTATDGNGKSNTTNFTVSVTWVNQVPTFNLAAGIASGITVHQFNTAVTAVNAVTNIDPGAGYGPGNQETSYPVSFIVTNDNPALFAVQPAVAANGTLTFTPATQGGSAVISVQAHDGGGTLNGGVDTSANENFVITVADNPFQDLTTGPGNTGLFTGLFYDTNGVIPTSSGYFALTLTNDGTFYVSVVCAGATNTVSGQFNTYLETNVAVAPYTLDLKLDAAGKTISGFVTNSGASWTAELQSYLAGLTTVTPGSYLVALPGFDNITEGPIGYSAFNVGIDTNGVATFAGSMADDAAAGQVTTLSATGYCPVYMPLYGNGTGGLLIGWLNFTNDPDNNLTDDSSLMWFNVAGATALYPAGFTNQAVAMASSYVTNAPYDNNLLGSSSASGYGYAVLSGGDLGANPVVKKVGITNNIISVVSAHDTSLSLTIAPGTGMVSGSYVDPKGNTNNIQSAIFQNGAFTAGYFIGVHTNQSGLFMLFGN